MSSVFKAAVDLLGESAADSRDADEQPWAQGLGRVHIEAGLYAFCLERIGNIRRVVSLIEGHRDA